MPDGSQTYGYTSSTIHSYIEKQKHRTLGANWLVHLHFDIHRSSPCSRPSFYGRSSTLPVSFSDSASLPVCVLL